MLRAPQPKRDAIIAAAADRFAVTGFANTRISDIARLAEIGKGTVYEYFNDKASLLLEACLWSCQVSEQSEVALTQQIDLVNPVPTTHRLMRGILTLSPVHSLSYSRLFFDLWAIAQDQPAILAQARERLQKVYRQRENTLMQVIVAGERLGFFRELGDAKFVSRCFTACVDGFMWQTTFRADVGPERLANEGADFFVQLLLCEPQRLREFCPLESAIKKTTIAV